MRAAISEVLETMFYVSVDFEDEAASSLVCVHQSSVSLNGEGRRLDISFEVSDGFARLITANLLGMDEGAVTADDMEDTMKELANMVVGDFQTRLVNGVWEMGIPATGVPGRGGKGREAGLIFGLLGEPSGVVILQCSSSGRRQTT